MSVQAQHVVGESWFETLYEKSPDAVFIESLDGEVLDVNSAGCHLHQCTREELVGKIAQELVPENVRAKVAKDFEDFETGTVFDFQSSSLRENGIIVPVEIRVTKIKYAGYDAMLLIVHDVTDREATAAALVESESRYKTLFETSPSAIFVTDLEGRMIDVNNTACRILGYERKELIGQEYSSISELSSGEFQHIVDEFKQHETTERLITYIRKDATKCVVEHRETKVRLPDGSEGVLIVANDISERIAVEQALKESDEKRRDLIDNMPAFVTTIDLDGRIVYLNQTQPGMSLNDVIGKSIFDFVDEEDAQRIREAFEEIVKTGEPRSIEIKSVGAHGSVAWYSSRFGPIKKDGKVVGLSGYSQEITDQKSAESDLRLSQQRYQNLVEDVDGIVWECKSDTLEFTYMSPRVEEILGYAVQEWYDDSELWARIIHPEDRERSVEYCRQRTEEGLDHEFEYRAITANDATVWIRDQVRLVRDKTGKVTLLRGIMSDVTELKRTEAYRDGENRVLEILAMGHSIEEALHELVVTVERAAPGMLCSVLLLNDDEKSLGQGVAPSLPYEYNLLIDGIEIGPNVGSCGTAAYLNEQVIVENTATDPLWSEYRELASRFNLQACWSNPIVSSGGNVLGTLAMYYRMPKRPSEVELELISTAAKLAAVAIEHKRTITAYRDSEEKFRTLFDHSPTAIFVENLEGMVLDANTAACELHGFSREQLIGQNVLDLVPTEARTRVKDDFTRIIDGDLVAFEGLSRHTNGRSIPVSIRVSKIEFQGERCLLFHVRDVTQRKRAEDEFRRQQDQLAHVSRLSTMGQMVAGLAHELNQPLYAISNFATACTHTLESGDIGTPDKLIEWTQKIADQANRAGEIIRRLRDFSRKDEAKHSDVDVNLLVRDSIDLVSAEARRDEIEIDCEFLEPSVDIHVDEIQIQQTLVNLLHNAIQASATVSRERKHVLIRLLRPSSETSRNNIQIDIEDQGIGLPEGASESLYDAFFTTKPDGMGMGLAISRSIVEAHGGQLWATSNPNIGTTFHFTLPFTGSTEIEEHD